MKRKPLFPVLGFLLALGLADVAVSPASGQVAPYFRGLGCLSQEGIYSHAWDLSADGTTVTGWSGVEGGLTQAFQWTQGTGMVGLPFLNSSDTESEGDGLSANGLIVAGHSGPEACRWMWVEYETGKWKWIVEGLGDLIGGTFSSRAYAMSYDGLVVVGEGNSAKGTEAVRWTPAGGMVGLGDLSGGKFWSQAMGCSADGSVLVGQGITKNGGMAFRWTAAKGMMALGALPKRKFSAAWGCSADGSVVVGQSFNANHTDVEAFRWTAATGMKGLGDLPGGVTGSDAEAVSPDGSIVVGGSATANEIEAFIWDATNGMRRLADFLAAKGVSIPPGWRLKWANSVTISSGVVTIAGVGINPNGETEAWIAAVMQ